QAIYDEFAIDSIIEEYLPGREFSVAILDNRLGPLPMPVEIISPRNSRGDRFLSREIKKTDVEQVIPVEHGATRIAVCKLALDVFTVLGARGHGRIDMRMDSQGIPHFL